MEYQLAIIGGGPAGYTAAEAAGKSGLKVVLFEENNVGGVCLNEGCIPTKALLYSAKVHDYAKHASKYGVAVAEASADLPKIIARKSKIVRKLTLGIKNKLAACGVEIVSGHAEIMGRGHVRCNETIYECGKLMLCTGSETFVPPLDGLSNVDYWTHRNALDNKELPASLAIIGGGVIGMEFASFFNSLGVKVTVIEMLDKILGPMDPEISAMLCAEYAKRGITFLLGTKVTSVAQKEDGIHVAYENRDGAGSVVAARLLLSVGRRPVTQGFGLENLGLKHTERGHIQTDEHLQSSVEGVYVCGDLNGVSLLAHTAVREAEVAVNHVLGVPDRMDYQAVPSVVYTNPEVAGVGATECQLQQRQIPYRVVKVPMAYSGRFVAENEGVNGLFKALVAEDGTVLGVHILGNPASEIISVATIAIETKMKWEDWKKIIFPHPTVCEIFREAF